MKYDIVASHLRKRIELNWWDIFIIDFILCSFPEKKNSWISLRNCTLSALPRRGFICVTGEHRYRIRADNQLLFES